MVYSYLCCAALTARMLQCDRLDCLSLWGVLNSLKLSFGRFKFCPHVCLFRLAVRLRFSGWLACNFPTYCAPYHPFINEWTNSSEWVLRRLPGDLPVLRLLCHLCKHAVMVFFALLRGLLHFRRTIRHILNDNKDLRCLLNHISSALYRITKI